MPERSIPAMPREWALNDKCEVVVPTSGKKYTGRSAAADTFATIVRACGLL